MAGATKRLRRKTTVTQKSCSELMMLTSEWWMRFLLPVGCRWHAAYIPDRIKSWRLLCKAWREVWDQGWRVRMVLHECLVGELCDVVSCCDDLQFIRDSSNRIEYFTSRRVHEGRKCWVSMPWKTFKRFLPLLHRMAALADLYSPYTEWFKVVYFAQTGFCLQTWLNERVDLRMLNCEERKQRDCK